MKKQLCMTLLLTIFMGMINLKSLAHDIEVTNANNITIYYNIIDGTELSVTYRDSWSVNHNTYSGNVVIPETVFYNGVNYSVTTIGMNAFRNCNDLTTITIPNSVTTIKYQAFMNCSGLTSVNIGSCVTDINQAAFYGCSGLTSITIPNSVTSIGSEAFEGCSGLTSVTIGNSVTSIGREAFTGCSSLTSITIPNSVTSIGSAAFSYTNIHLINYVVTDWETFYSKGLSAINRNVGYTELNIINEYGENITEIHFPNNITTIVDYAFYRCNSLTSVTIPNSVTTIGNYAFSQCI